MSQMPTTPPPPIRQPPPPPTPGRRTSNWPRVIGVISIALGALAVLGAAVGLAMQAISAAVGRGRTPFFAMPESMAAWNAISNVIGIGFGVLLLAAGVMLLKRRPVARTMHLVYVPCAIVMDLIGTILMLASIDEFVELMGRDMPGRTPAEFEAMMRAAIAAGAVIGGLIGLIYPVFLLIWFSRGKIRQEMAAWAGGQAQVFS